MANIYQYRIVHVYPSDHPSTDLAGFYATQYSADAGTTWNFLHPFTFQSAIDAQQSLQNIINDEQNFANAVNGKSYANPHLKPASTTNLYPT